MVDLLKIPDITHAAPVIEAYPLVRGKDAEILLVQGIDLLREEGLRDYTLESGKHWDFSEWESLMAPDAIALCKSFAQRYGLNVGDRLLISYNQVEKEVTIKKLLIEEGPAIALGGNFALMDIASAQEAFDKIGRLDRIDIISSP